MQQAIKGGSAMNTTRWRSSLWIAVLVAIGCGGGRPQDASATTDAGATEPPVRLAEAPAASSPAAPAAPSGAPAAGGGTVTGSIRFEGTAPAPTKVQMSADPICAQAHSSPVMTEDVVVNANGTLKNVVVYVKEGADARPAPQVPVVLDQQGCWYSPHVFTLQVDQPLQIVNSDATMHNVNAKPGANQAFNLAQPTKGMKSTKKFTKPEAGVKFKCNVHPWMSAYAVVTPHGFASVSGDDGTFAIAGLPAGTYTLEAWHEKYGTQTATITVPEGGAATADFVFKAQ
jgi:plastocyanin